MTFTTQKVIVGCIVIIMYLLVNYMQLDSQNCLPKRNDCFIKDDFKYYSQNCSF